MSKDFSILVATTGNGIWHSGDSGKSFHWGKGVNNVDTVVRGFGVDAHDPRHVIAGAALAGPPFSPLVGSQYGLHESFDGGASWAPVETFPRVECWRITFDPAVPGRYFVGTRPSDIYRTEDGGKSFEKLPTGLPDTCFGIGLPRVTSIVLHPKDPSIIISSTEIGGMRRSLDGGDSWEPVMTNIDTPVPNGAVAGVEGRLDCHFSGISAGQPDLMLVSTPDGVYASGDLGKTWADFPVKQVFRSQYHKEFAIKLDDPDTIFQGVGDDTAGQEGAIVYTRDRGVTWDTADLPDECNSPIWCFAVHPSDPDIILACTHKGQLFGSEDGGQSWVKYRREFSDVRGICWLPS